MKKESKIAVVTGAGQGLGAAVAAKLAGRGFRVALLGRTLTKLRMVADRLPSDPICATLDLCDPDQVRECLQALDEAGPVGVLVNNAAVYSPFRLDEATDGQIASVVQSSFVAPIYIYDAGGHPAHSRVRRRRYRQHIVGIGPLSIALPHRLSGLQSRTRASDRQLSSRDARRRRFSLFQTGMINAPNSGATWDRDIAARAHEAWTSGAMCAFCRRPGVTPETLADTIAHIICLPPEAVIHAVHMTSPASHAGLVPRDQL